MILLVLFYHDTGGIYTFWLNFFPLHDLLISAPTAVSYLYVLSGFVMSLVYFRPNEKFDIAGYWRARFVRIYPLYIISFLLICIYYADSIFQIKPQKIVANLFVIQAWIPDYSQSFNYASWSMTVEFFFYAIFPFFVLWAYRQSTKKLIWLSIALWAVSQTIHFSLWIGYHPQAANILNYFPLFHLNSFILGVVGGIWYLRQGRDEKVKPATLFTVLIGCFLFVAVYTVVSTSIYPALPHNLQPMAGWLSPFMILFIVALAMDKSRFSQMLNHPWLVNLGEASYAIYILHVPTFWLYERALADSSVADPAYVFGATFLPMMISIGILAHFFVDVPLRKRLRDLLKRVSARLFFADLAFTSLFVFLLFRLRFGEGREYQTYREMERLMFWCVFLLRPAISLAFDTFNPANFQKPFVQMIRRVVLAVTLGSVLITGILYAGYFTGWFENFPRSIFFIDWLAVLVFSMLTRFIFHALKIYKPDPLPA
jgi:peptidoglycan/LPS O-acetylase OafA/YrhL